MGGAYSTHGKTRNAYTILVGKLEGKSPVERTRNRREDDIKTV
jgi:hypothetical protein